MQGNSSWVNWKIFIKLKHLTWLIPKLFYVNPVIKVNWKDLGKSSFFGTNYRCFVEKYIALFGSLFVVKCERLKSLSDEHLRSVMRSTGELCNLVLLAWSTWSTRNHLPRTEMQMWMVQNVFCDFYLIRRRVWPITWQKYKPLAMTPDSTCGLRKSWMNKTLFLIICTLRQ